MMKGPPPPPPPVTCHRFKNVFLSNKYVSHVEPETRRVEKQPFFILNYYSVTL